MSCWSAKANDEARQARNTCIYMYNVHVHGYTYMYMYMYNKLLGGTYMYTCTHAHVCCVTKLMVGSILGWLVGQQGIHIHETCLAHHPVYIHKENGCALA